MPHELETMVYYGTPPWHGLGTAVDHAMDSEEALTLAGLDWSVQAEPIYTADMVPIEGFSANVRRSDRMVLGVVSDHYQILQNREAFGFMDTLVGEGVAYHTAGSLRTGRRVWICAKFPEPLRLGPDRGELYVVFSNGHDGHFGVQAHVTPIRVVCQNTLNFAIAKAQRRWSMRHVGHIQAHLHEARAALDLAQAYGRALEHDADRLLHQVLPYESFLQLIEALVPMGPDDTERKIQQAAHTREQILKAYRATDLRPYHGTAWAALNAVAAHTDHAAGGRRTATQTERKFRRIIDGDPLLDEAYAMLSA